MSKNTSLLSWLVAGASLRHPRELTAGIDDRTQDAIKSLTSRYRASRGNHSLLTHPPLVRYKKRKTNQRALTAEWPPQNRERQNTEIDTTYACVDQTVSTSRTPGEIQQCCGTDTDGRSIVPWRYSSTISDQTPRTNFDQYSQSRRSHLGSESKFLTEGHKNVVIPSSDHTVQLWDATLCDWPVSN